MIHNLKCWPTPFAYIRAGLKTCEFRQVRDRTFKVGDTLILNEYDPDTKEESGEQEIRQVTHVLHGGEFGVPKGYVVISLGAG